jgi:uncharacterized protein with HEPN domain
MPRDSRVYLEDILASVAKIRSYVAGMEEPHFAQDAKTVDAVVRNLEIIGDGGSRCSWRSSLATSRQSANTTRGAPLNRVSARPK